MWIEQKYAYVCLKCNATVLSDYPADGGPCNICNTISWQESDPRSLFFIYHSMLAFHRMPKRWSTFDRFVRWALNNGWGSNKTFVSSSIDFGPKTCSFV